MVIITGGAEFPSLHLHPSQGSSSCHIELLADHLLRNASELLILSLKDFEAYFAQPQRIVLRYNAGQCVTLVFHTLRRINSWDLPCSDGLCWPVVIANGRVDSSICFLNVEKLSTRRFVSKLSDIVESLNDLMNMLEMTYGVVASYQFLAAERERASA